MLALLFLTLGLIGLWAGATLVVESAKKIATDRNSLIVITGSTGIITEYFNHKGIKKF